MALVLTGTFCWCPQVPAAVRRSVMRLLACPGCGAIPPQHLVVETPLRCSASAWNRPPSAAIAIDRPVSSSPQPTSASPPSWRTPSFVQLALSPLAAQGGREVRLQLSSDRAGPVLVEHAGCGNDGLTAYLETVDGAISDNTRRALRADITVFDVWCRRRGARAFPAGAATLAAFVDEMAGSRTPATVRRYVSSIAAVHRGLGAPAPHEAAAARVAVQRMHRRSGRR